MFFIALVLQKICWLEPERDNPNDIRTKLAQNVQVAQKWLLSRPNGPILMPHRTQNIIFRVESSSSEETPNTPLTSLGQVKLKMSVFSATI